MKTEYAESALSFAEWDDPTSNQVATVLMDRPGGRMAVIATIHKGYDPNAKKTVYRTYDTDDKEILAPNFSLVQLKKEIRRKEQEFHEQVSLKEQAIRQDAAEEERKRFKELSTLRSRKTKSQSRTR